MKEATRSYGIGSHSDVGDQSLRARIRDYAGDDNANLEQATVHLYFDALTSYFAKSAISVYARMGPSQTRYSRRRLW